MKRGVAKKQFVIPPNPLTLNSSSLAKTYGITRIDGKTEINHLGINPNIDFQNQYIENLLKQINYLSLQTKLLKEKQKQTKRGLQLQQSNLPAAQHVYESNLKFGDMKVTLSDQINKGQQFLLRLQQQSLALRTKKQGLKKNLESEQISQTQCIISYRGLLQALTKQNQQERNKSKASQKELDKLKHQIQDLETNLGKTVKSVQTKIYNDNIQKELFESDVQYLKNQKERKLKQLSQIKLYIQFRKNQISAEKSFVDLTKENAELQRRLKEGQRVCADQEYKNKQFEFLKNIYTSQRDLQIAEKQQFREEFDKVKLMLDETRKLISSKVQRQLKFRQKDSVPILRLQNELVQTSKSFQELNARKSQIEQNIRKLRLETEQLSFELQSLRQQKQVYEQDLKNLSIKQNDLTQKCREETISDRQNSERLLVLNQEIAITKKQYLDIQEQYEYLRARLAFMQDNVHLNEQLKNLHLQDLRTLMENNKDVVGSLGQLSRQWQSIRNFAR